MQPLWGTDRETAQGGEREDNLLWLSPASPSFLLVVLSVSHGEAELNAVAHCPAKVAS